jgi:hypothetical protein
MTYSIFDTGNLVVSYDREDAARHALARIAAEVPDADACLLLVAFDDDGHVVDEVAPSDSLAA